MIMTMIIDGDCDDDCTGFYFTNETDKSNLLKEETGVSSKH